MIRYRNLGGSSGVNSYEIGGDYIKIKFNGTAGVYTYSYRRAGRNHVESMNGRGLNAYVNRFVKFRYD